VTQPRPAHTPFVEVLYFDGCPNHVGLTDHLRELFTRHAIAAHVTQQRIDTDEQAIALRFLGSPTIRVDGHDVEPGADARHGYGLQCRLYPTQDGLRGTPPDTWILTALDRPPHQPHREDDTGPTTVT
jgi:hypothetical protein